MKARAIDPEEPFRTVIRPRWMPPEMVRAPKLDDTLSAPAVEKRRINPFYPKDPHASFGKHVLTPTLALTSVAAATPSSWRVEYWDENVLHGRPPWEPMPEVVGITVHLTFAQRAYAVCVDNNLGANPEYLRELCRALRPLGKIWSAAVTIDVTDEPDLVREMAIAGCTGVFIGFESLSDANLARSRKRSPRTGDYARRVGIFHDCGICVSGSNSSTAGSHPISSASRVAGRSATPSPRFVHSSEHEDYFASIR